MKLISKKREIVFNKYIKCLSIIGTVGLLISGCASKYEVQFDSNPKGASLICGGKNWGYTPKSLYLERDQFEGKQIIPVDCHAQWISGASKIYPSIPLDKYPDGVRLTIDRDMGDGYEKDVQFGLQVELMNSQRELMEAQANSASATRFNNFLNNQRSNQLQQQNNQLQQQQNYQLYKMNNYLRYGY